MRPPSVQEWLFAVRTFAAAMTALGLALWIDLPRPYWALASVYIASQSFTGATQSKAAFRAIGTVLGGVAALVLVPLLVNSPLLLSLGLALWVGGCLFFALLDRTPRSYVFMLGGYTAAIIGFPSVDAPEAIFDTVLSRSEEILLGIACAALFSTVLFPRGVGPALGLRVGAWLREADAWALDALAGRAEDAAYIARQRRLAAGVVEIETMAASLAWDAGPIAARSMRSMRHDLLLMLPMLSSLDDRVGVLGHLPQADADRARAARAVEAAKDWVQAGAVGEPAAPVAAAATLAADSAGRTDWPGLLLSSLADRLGDYASLRAASGRLRLEVAGTEPPLPRPDVVDRAHRDPAMALLSAAAAAVAILLCCGLWIATAWPDGATAAELAAVACSFFATQDNPVPAILGFLRWSVVAVVVDAILLFGVLPQAESFEMLVVALAPVLLIYGLLIARPSTTQAGVALAANGTTLLGIQSSYSADFAAFTNSALAFISGLALAAIVTSVMRAVGAAWSVQRLQRANWATLAAAARGYGDGDREQVAALLLDRVALVSTRLAAVELDSPVLKVRALDHIRIGMNVVELRRGRRGLPETARRTVEAAMDLLALHFAELANGRGAEPSGALLASLDCALEAVGRLPPGDARRNALQGLVGVHRGLCPGRMPAPGLLAA